MALPESYRKVRKLTEGQNLKLGTISAIMIEILRFLALITQRGDIEASEPFILFIG